MDRVRGQFEKAQAEWAEFQDSNLNPATTRAQVRGEELQAEYQRLSNLYNSLSQQLQQARIRVQESTPVFSIIQPVNQPLEKSKPKSSLILLFSILLGAMVGIAWVLLSDLKEEFSQNVLQSGSTP
ncbi:MAG: GNVR domain-containing protein [Balneolaceae bacterium]|nr:GNVR domain-containing protein [Balneolaceae bacterium]